MGPCLTVCAVASVAGVALWAAERALRRGRPEAGYGRYARWAHPAGRWPVAPLNRVAGSRLLRARGERVPSVAFVSGITDVVHVNHVVDARRLAPLVPAGLEPQCLGERGDRAVLTFLSYRTAIWVRPVSAGGGGCCRRHCRATGVSACVMRARAWTARTSSVRPSAARRMPWGPASSPRDCPCTSWGGTRDSSSRADGSTSCRIPGAAARRPPRRASYPCPNDRRTVPGAPPSRATRRCRPTASPRTARCPSSHGVVVRYGRRSPSASLPRDASPCPERSRPPPPAPWSATPSRSRSWSPPYGSVSRRRRTPRCDRGAAPDPAA